MWLLQKRLIGELMFRKTWVQIPREAGNIFFTFCALKSLLENFVRLKRLGVLNKVINWYILCYNIVLEHDKIWVLAKIPVTEKRNFTLRRRKDIVGSILQLSSNSTLWPFPDSSSSFVFNELLNVRGDLGSVNSFLSPVETAVNVCLPGLVKIGQLSFSWHWPFEVSYL